MVLDCNSEGEEEEYELVDMELMYKLVDICCEMVGATLSSPVSLIDVGESLSPRC